MLTGGEYIPTESRASWAAPSRPEAGRRPSQQERRRLQPTADSVCRGSWGTPGACRAAQISLVAPAQPLIASTCVQARCQKAHCKGCHYFLPGSLELIPKVYPWGILNAAWVPCHNTSQYKGLLL